MGGGADVMEQWVIYDRPSDYPDHYVVRCWYVGARGAAAGPEVWLRPTLDEAREVVAGNYPGGYCLPRSPGDDPVIVEVWI